MRINRFVQLSPSAGTVHLYWRCHNREFYLNDPEIKKLYFACIEKGLKYRKQGLNFQIHAYCAMGNHFHMAGSYQNGAANLSNFMRYTHGIFGARYNRLNQRSGKVAQGRPKTPLVQDDEHAMRVHFYIEANPIRAKMRKLSNLKNFQYSSYGFYAHGLKTQFSELLTIPAWYLKLGRNSRERQIAYRRLFAKYLGEFHEEYSTHYKQRFIGHDQWIIESNLYVKESMKAKSEKSGSDLVLVNTNDSG